MPTYNNPTWIIAIVALITMLGPFSIDTYLPSFPAIEQDFNVSRALMMQTLAVYLISFALATLVWGPMSDYWGRRRVILVSLSGYLLASIVCALASSFEVLLLGRIFQGIMAAGSLTASRAMIRDYFSGHEAQKAMALIMMLFAVAPAIAPILGGWLEVHLGWRAVFMFLFLFALLVTLLFFLQVPETQDPAHRQSLHPQKVARSYWQSIKHPQFLRFAVTQGFLMGGFFLYIAGSSSIIYDHLGLHEQDFWRFFVPMVAGVLMGSGLVHQLTPRLNKAQLVHVALVTASVGVLINIILLHFVAPTIVSVIIPLVIYSAGFAMANPGLTVLGLDCFPRKRGLASSVQSLFQIGIAGLVTAVLVPLVHHNLAYIVYTQAALFSLCLLLWWTLIPALQRQK